MKSLSKVLTSIIGSATLAAPVISTPYFVFSKSNDPVLDSSHEDFSVLNIANKDNPNEPGAMIPTPQPDVVSKTPKQPDRSGQPPRISVPIPPQKSGKRVFKNKKNLYGPFVSALKGFVDYGKRSIRKGLEKKLESLGLGDENITGLWEILNKIAKSGSESSASTDPQENQGPAPTS